MRSRRLGVGLALVAASAVGVLGGAPGTAVAADENSCKPGNVVFTPSTPSAFPLLQADAANKLNTGAGVLVAVVDSGIDASNPHLTGAVIGGVDLVGDGERSDGLSDPYGHGTVIAGEIAARPVNGSGLVGLAPDADLLSVRVFRSDDDESKRDGFGPSAARLAQGIRYAADQHAQIINVSLSDVGDTPDLKAAVADARARGSLVVASAGNRATTANTTDGPRYPADYLGSLGVTAADTAGKVTDDSIHGPQVDVAAPGQSVLSTATGAGDCIYQNDTPSSSYATGYASAAAALVAAAHPEEGPDGWAYRLEASAARTDPDARDDVNGWGLIQPADAITLLPGASTRGPESPFFDTSNSAVLPPVETVTASENPSPFAPTVQALLLVAIVGVALLGTIATALVLRRRRAADAVVVDPEPSGPGLLERTPVD